MKKLLPLLLLGGAAVALSSGKKKKKKTPDDLDLEEEIIIKEALKDSEKRESKTEVKRQQTILKELSDFYGESEWDPGKVDGKKGPNTIQAIKGFQKASGITSDGIWGDKTERRAQELLEQMTERGGGSIGNRITYPDDLGNSVSQIVRGLKTAGVYDTTATSRSKAKADMLKEVKVQLDGVDTPVSQLPESPEKKVITEIIYKAVDNAL